MDGSTTLSEVMNKNVITLSPEDTVDKVHGIFSTHAFHHLPVLDKDQEVVGIVSSSDLLKISLGFCLFKVDGKSSYNEALYRSLLVREIMTKEVETMGPEDTIQEAYACFSKGDFRIIPIVSEGHLLGIVTPLDLVAAFLDMSEVSA